jgi:hypothetical protein
MMRTIRLLLASLLAGGAVAAPFTVTAPGTVGTNSLGNNVPEAVVGAPDFTGPKAGAAAPQNNMPLPAIPHATALRAMRPDPPKGANLKSVQSLPGLPAWQPGPQISPVVGNGGR